MKVSEQLDFARVHGYKRSDIIWLIESMSLASEPRGDVLQRCTGGLGQSDRETNSSCNLRIRPSSSVGAALYDVCSLGGMRQRPRAIHTWNRTRRHLRVLVFTPNWRRRIQVSYNRRRD
jgi:hypothetical protein